MFSKHSNNNWQNAPTLVSDFRFIRRRRSLPKEEETNPTLLIKQLNKINIDINIKKSVKFCLKICLLLIFKSVPQK